jgi:beta-glucanase (GH16 family)
MKSNFITKLIILVLAMVPYFAEGQDTPKTKKLIWSDEFDYTGLPAEKDWNIQVGKSRANNEPQWYTRELRNLEVANGVLTITVLQEDADSTKRYTSGRINTRGKHEFQYGRIEARAKLPQGRGVWPAFWMLGLTGGWPACGEIDIMEYWGHDKNIVASNVHTKDYNHTKGTGRGGKTEYPDPYKDFHIYAVEWYPERMDFFMDDKLFYTCKSKGEGPGEWPFNAPEYIILNLALWNNWGGQPGIDNSIFPQKFIVDYVRVYEFK